MLSKLWSGHAFGWQEWGPLLQAFIAFAWIIYGAESWLDVRQHKLFDVKKKPAELTYVQQDEFEKAQKCTFVWVAAGLTGRPRWEIGS